MVSRNYCFLFLLALFPAVHSQPQCAKGDVPGECSVCTDTEIVCQRLTTERLPSLSTYFPNVTEVSMTNGFITEIPARYFQSTGMTTLNLSDNELTGLNMDSFEYTTLLEVIDLTGNPILCNQSIDWLKLWLGYYPFNTVTGTCNITGMTLLDYLADKPKDLVEIIAPPAYKVGRHCEDVTLTFSVERHTVTDPLTYKISTQYTNSVVELIKPGPITIPSGSSSATISLSVHNSGVAGETTQVTISVKPLYPISYETTLRVDLVDDGASCTITPEPPTSKTPDLDPTTSTTTSPGMQTTSAVTPPDDGLSGVAIFFIVLFIIAACAIIALVIYKKWIASKKVSGNPEKKVKYSEVNVEAGEGKVYNDTTEDI